MWNKKKINITLSYLTQFERFSVLPFYVNPIRVCFMCTEESFNAPSNMVWGGDHLPPRVLMIKNLVTERVKSLDRLRKDLTNFVILCYKASLLDYIKKKTFL